MSYNENVLKGYKQVIYKNSVHTLKNSSCFQQLLRYFVYSSRFQSLLLAALIHSVRETRLLAENWLFNES